MSAWYWHWDSITLEGSVEYTVVLKEINGTKIPFGVKVSEYVPDPPQVVTLKPINR